MRADKFLAEKFGSRTKAAEAIEKGWVLVDGKPIKPKTEICDDDKITFVPIDKKFVSNGGYKLERGLKTFQYDCKNKFFADIGASTGGFTDCLLQRGVAKVYAIDVGESLLHDALRGNDRIVAMENTNARYLTKENFADELDGVVTDVSFISLRLIFPVVKQILKNDGDAFVLIKPQFECENKHIGKSGIVSPSVHCDIIKKVLGYLRESGLYPHGIINAPVKKGKNIEYVLYIRPIWQDAKSDQEILDLVKVLIKKNSLGELQ